jgi:branched-chain amino acid aminotransferase
MTRLFSLNGRIIPSLRATVSAHDRGFIYGDSAYETLRCYDGLPFLFPEHWRRMRASCGRLDIPFPWSRRGQQAHLQKMLRRARLSSASVRIVVTRGVGSIRMAPERGLRPNLMFYVQPFKPFPESFYRRGIDVALGALRRNPIVSLDPRIKSSNLLNNVLASMQANRRGAMEALMLNPAGFLAEGASSNLFLVRRGEVLTPPLSEGILGGITRAVLFSLAREQRIPLRERHLRERELWACDEAFITSTLKEVLPIRSCNGRRVGGGRPGPLTLRLLAAFRTFRARWTRRRLAR